MPPKAQNAYTHLETKMLQEIYADVRFLLLLCKRSDIPQDIADQANDRFWKLQKLAEHVTACKRQDAVRNNREPPPPLMPDIKTRYTRAEIEPRRKRPDGRKNNQPPTKKEERP